VNELSDRYSRRVMSSCSTSDTRRATVCQYIVELWWFSPVSYFNKIDQYDITKIILVLKTLNTSIFSDGLWLGLGLYVRVRVDILLSCRTHVIISSFL
jgi:hypothetical protein